MMKQSGITLTAVLAVLLTAGGASTAAAQESQPQDMQSPDARPQGMLPQGKQPQAPLSAAPAPARAAPVAKTAANGISYLCGGIGADEAERMRRQAADYNLMLSFTAKDAGYLANVDVAIADHAGKPLLKTFCDAPILLVNLPKSGSYRLRAEAGGITLKKEVAVDASGKETASVVLAWPHQLAESMDNPAPTSSGDSGPPGNSAAGGENEGPANFDFRRHQ